MLSLPPSVIFYGSVGTGKPYTIMLKKCCPFTSSQRSKPFVVQKLETYPRSALIVLFACNPMFVSYFTAHTARTQAYWGIIVIKVTSNIFPFAGIEQ